MSYTLNLINSLQKKEVYTLIVYINPLPIKTTLKLKITFTTGMQNIILPKEFNHILQALIYRFLNRISAEWLHQHGFQLEKRTFKLFAFSSILQRGKLLSEKGLFSFPETISFFVSSPVLWILEQFANNIILNERVDLGNNKVFIASIEVFKDNHIKSNKIKVNALTPIEVHSTLSKKDGSKKTYYYSPLESEYNKLVNDNLRKKWQACYQKECPYNINIIPVDMKHCRERARSFKGFIIKGWTGHFWLESEPEFLSFATLTGLGSKNSMGFGFVEEVGKGR